MKNKVSDEEKKEIMQSFMKGINIKDLSDIYGFTIPTITKHLKKLLGKEVFDKIKKANINKKIDLNNLEETEKSFSKNNDFYEITPLANEIDQEIQKDLSSEPLQNANLPLIVYLLVDKKIELEPKLLREYPEWSFLPEQDLNRMSLEIFDDHNYAKKLCSKNQKLIKVPNPNVFLLASSSLKSKGITRIIFNNLLFSL